MITSARSRWRGGTRLRIPCEQGLGVDRDVVGGDEDQDERAQHARHAQADRGDRPDQLRRVVGVVLGEVLDAVGDLARLGPRASWICSRRSSTMPGHVVHELVRLVDERAGSRARSRRRPPPAPASSASRAPIGRGMSNLRSRRSATEAAPTATITVISTASRSVSSCSKSRPSTSSPAASRTAAVGDRRASWAPGPWSRSLLPDYPDGSRVYAVTNEEAHRRARERGPSQAPLRAGARAVVVAFMRVWFRLSIAGAEHIPARRRGHRHPEPQELLGLVLRRRRHPAAAAVHGQVGAVRGRARAAARARSARSPCGAARPTPTRWRPRA